MNKLNYKTLEEVGYDGYILKDAPEKVLQFGEGNFLRAFVDYWFDLMNEKVGFNGKVVLCQPIANGLANMINEQEGLYTLYLRGFENGKKVNDKRVLSSVSRCLNPYEDYQAVLDCAKNPELRYIVSNTTEAGIVYDASCKFEDTPASSFPGKLTQFLYERFKNFGKEEGKGFVILSCELIDDNGKELEKCVLQYVDQWGLGEEFKNWVQKENIFCSTLVDRIVTGYPRNEAASLCEELGYEDNLIDTAEVFGFWVIEGPEELKKELKFKEAGLPVIICDNHKPYKQRKVRILNGAHTSMVLGAYLAGQTIVRDCMNDEVISGFMNKTIYDEIIPTLTLPEEELKEFAAAVSERFNNPFIDHALLSIALNSTSKWKARVMPSLKGYVEKFDKVPAHIAASLAFYIKFYVGEGYEIKDDEYVLEFYKEHKNDDNKTLANAVLSNVDFWGEDLTLVKDLLEIVEKDLDVIDDKGAYELMKML